jgi:hypothetical protein
MIRAAGGEVKPGSYPRLESQRQLSIPMRDEPEDRVHLAWMKGSFVSSTGAAIH